MPYGLALVWGLLLLSGCATLDVPEPITVPELPLLPQATVADVAEPEVPPAEMNRLMDSEPTWPEESSTRAIASAVRRATMGPASVGFQRGMLIYPYREGQIYRIDVPFVGGTHLAFPAGEEIKIDGGLREIDWFVQKSDAVDPQESSHIFLTPKRCPARGQYTVVTSKAAYYLAVQCHETHGLYGVTWRHPRTIHP